MSLALASGAGVALTAPAAAAAPPVSSAVKAADAAPAVDELPNPQEDKRRALRQEAISDVLAGTAEAVKRGGSTVVKVGKTPGDHARGKAGTAATDQYVEVAREKTDKILVVLAEFGDKRATDIDPRYGDMDTDPTTDGPATFDGPLHNAIPEPDRGSDNSTNWKPNYSADYYRKMYFGTGSTTESLRTYYERQSSGRYSVNGLVSDWVKVPYNEARYGRSDGFPCASNVCSNTWYLIRDAVDQLVADYKAEGASDAWIKNQLKSYDQWDRYDYDHDGNFNEPDGYIDHFQIVHAGGDQADGDPHQGEDAIWSHRWKAFQNHTDGPSYNKDGGTQIGDTGLWIADYTIQPENGGLSVFTHEYGHDLGLPDEYDTAGGPDNAVNWWSLMAQSRARDKNDEGIGTRPADLGAWDKIQLGWFDYETVVAGQNKTLELGPHEYNSTKAQGAVVVLPPKEVTTTLVPPAAGTKSWWSGKGDDLNTTLTRDVTLPAGTATLSFQANWNIEDCGPDACDYAYVEVDNGSGWKAIPGDITTADEGNGIDGDSNGWQPATFDLSAYAGTTIGLRFHYATDGAAGGIGFFADEISLVAGGATVFTDGAEDGANGWTADGFETVGGSKTTDYANYYIASNREYVSYDKYLQYGPYNFGFPQQPNRVEFFPYQNGLLVSYWDTSFSDNNESQHPGGGLILPIDAHPEPIYNLDGQPWRGRIQTYDAPFSLEKADSFTLHTPANGTASYVRGQAARPVFDDTSQYWYPQIPTVGVKVANAGVRIRVVSTSGTSMKIRVAAKK